jgi:hypothetical protein
MYAKISNNQLIQYPANPRLDNPYVSFPDNWGGGIVDEAEYALVEPSSPPSANLGWFATEITPTYSNNKWEQTWSVSLHDKPQLKQIVTSYRYDVEVGGVVVNGYPFSTDRESQTKYIAAVVAAAQTPDPETFIMTWKTSDGQFIPLTVSSITSVTNAVREHVQNCFDKEAEYYNLIDTANTSVLETTDFSAGWPSNN